MVLNLFLPLEGSDLLSLSRVYMSLTMLSLLCGQPLMAAIFSIVSVVILHSNAHQSSRYDGLEKWLILGSLSAAASAGSSLLLFLAGRQPSDQAYRTWFFGQALEKIWGLILGFVLYKELTSPLPAGRRSVRRESSLAVVLLEVRVRIVRGRNLVAKDHNLFGRPTSSDPYVVVHLGNNEMGRTAIVPKSLNPTWPPNLFRRKVPEKSVGVFQSIECCIFDNDKMSKDDPMGTVYVPVPKVQNERVARWYRVGEGRGENHCPDATGDLMVEVEVASRP